MDIARSAHEHPLLLTGGDNEDDEPVVCYACKDLICGPRFSCFICEFHFHESCTDLPPRLLDHPLHPRHPLSLTQGSKFYICRACDEEGNGFLYHCSQCHFGLHIRCALSVDREGNIVWESTGEKDNFRYELHQHLLELEKEQSAYLETNGVNCFGCSDSISSPFFSCSRLGCEFKIHEYCANLPKQIKNSFLHPKLSLFLVTQRQSGTSCQICGQKGSSFYACAEPDLSIHPKCIFSNPRDSMKWVGEKQIQHRSHHHNLTLLADEKEWAWTENDNPSCSLCMEQFASSPRYGCELCKAFIIHQSCAELPGQIKSHLHHKHSLVLFATIQSIRSIFCDCCGTEVTNLNYGCLQCEFTLHSDCFVSLHGSEPYDHHHNFVHNKTFRKLACDACGEENHFCPWQCTGCHVMVHKKCSELSRFIRVDRHRHVLKLTYYLSVVHECDKLICQLCYKEINVDYAVYYCQLCKYATHLGCGDNIGVAVSEEESQDDSFFVGSHISKGGGFQHSTHRHELTLNEQDREEHEHKYCEGCVTIISSSPFYSCNDCSFYLHKECAETSEIGIFPFHYHSLQLNLVEEPVFCEVCKKTFNSFMYSCQFKDCSFIIDLRCVKLMEGVDHPCHEHRLFFPDPSIREYETCKGCGRQSRYILVCSECEYVLGYCCAKLPHNVKHRYDEHLLSLATFEKENESREYYCDICEDERDPEDWFYRCMECNFYAHLYCALGDLSYIRFGSTFKIDFHDHPVTYVEQSMRKPPPLCRACSKHCHSRLLECRRCSFQVHAVESCYGSFGSVLQY